MSDLHPVVHLARRAWQAFTRLRRTRPFWGSLVLLAGGYFVMAPVMGSSMSLLLHLGASGAAPYLLGGGMMAAAAVSMVVPAQRHFPALMAVACSVASLPLANLGGWLLGMVLGIVGSGMVFAWAPYTETQLAKFEARDQQRADARAARAARTPRSARKAAA